MQKQVSTQKSTNNPMSSFGLIEENMELSHIHLAVNVVYDDYEGLILCPCIICLHMVKKKILPRKNPNLLKVNASREPFT